MDEELDYIRNVFGKLSYPPHVINNVLKRCKKKFYSTKTTTPLDPKKIIILPIDLPRVKNILYPDIKVVTGASMNIGGFLKHNFNTFDHSSGVYKVPCKDCNQIYIGETNDFGRRLYQHKYALKTGDSNSSLHLHRLRYSHRVSLNDASIICKSDSLDKRLLLECFFY